MAAPSAVLTPKPTAAPTPSPELKPAPRAELQPAAFSSSVPAISLLCFAWSPLSHHDVALYAEAKRSMARCDQFRVYTDTAHNDTIGDGHIVKVEVPEQTVPRDDHGWLYHRNMVGMMPSLAHLLAAGEWSGFDWVLNVELDHFVHADRVRVHIGHTLDLLRAGGEQEQKDVGGPLMLMMGNAFAFNKAALAQLSRQWHELGRVAADLPARGCPLFMKGGLEYPEHCSQDIVFPHMVNVMQPRLPAYGASGCGQADQTNGMGKRLPLACWDTSDDFWNPWPTGSEDMQQLAIRVLAAVQHMGTPAEINSYLQTVLANNQLPDFCRDRVAMQIKTNHFFTARKVPIIHHVNHASVHRLARELLEP